MSVSGVCGAQVQYTSTTRSLLAQNQQPQGGPSTQTYTLPGPWQEQAYYEQDSGITGPPPWGGLLEGGGWARQTSNLSESVISGTLFAQAFDGTQAYSGFASSSVQASFTLLAATPLQIGGTWSSQPSGTQFGGAGTARFTLTGPGGTVYTGGRNASDQSNFSGTLSYTGILQPGSYTLDVLVSYGYGGLGIIGDRRSSSLDFTMTVPAPGAAVVLAGTVIGIRRRRSI